MKKYNFHLFIIIAIIFSSCGKQIRKSNKADVALTDKIETTLTLAAEQYSYMMKNLPENRFPKTFNKSTDKLETSNSGWWCSGFYPGTLLYLYEHNGEETFYRECLASLKALEKEQYNTSTHDLGFMMFCSFGNANRIAPKLEYNNILIQSAKSLFSRFNNQVGAIKSWDSKEDDFLVIIDNMMNLELLFWATQHTGDSSYYKLAVRHADTTIKNHFRDDYSSYHVINYDPGTGQVKHKRTAQGYSNESAWARGQAWGLYGFIIMYRSTKNEKYLDQATAIAEFILNHPNLPDDKIPYWDFNAPNIPDEFRDSSAGAIIASALLELSEYVERENARKYLKNAELILTTLMSDEYLANPKTNGGFLLEHGVGHIPQNSEVDVPLTYGDYYFVEAMLRYKAKNKDNIAL